MTGQLKLFDLDPKDADDSDDQRLESFQLTSQIPEISQDTLPEGSVLALTRGYEMQQIHVTRIISYLDEQRENDELLGREQISKDLYIPLERVKGNINVLIKAGLVTSHNRLTPFGVLIHKYAPFWDNIGCLWLIHYLLSSNAKLILWSNIFNKVLQDGQEISINQVAKAFTPFIGRWSEKTIKTKVPQEIGGIFRSYAETIFSPLRILIKSEVGNYEANCAFGGVPSIVFLSALLAYRDQYFDGASSLEVPLLIDKVFSPGRIFYMNEKEVRSTLDDLHTNDFITVETRSGLDQVRFKREITWLSAITAYLQGS